MAKSDLHISVFPDYRRDNPYQELLSDALEDLGATCRFPIGYRRGLPFTRDLANSARSDVFHLHWLSPYLKGETSAVRAIYAAKLVMDCSIVKARGSAIVWTVHNLISHDSRSPGLELWVSKQLCGIADRLIVHSPEAKKSVVGEFGVPDEKVAIIPHGSYAKAYGKKTPKELAKRKLGIDSELPLVLFFGMIRPYKGVLELISVWKNSSNLNENAMLVIAGDARDKSHAAEVRSAVNGITNLKLDMRFIPDEDVATYFSAADIAVFPFKDSLTSGTVALADTYGIPVVARALDGTISGKGLHQMTLYDDRNRTLADAISFALEDPIDQLEGEAHNADDWPRIAYEHLDVYRSAIAEKPKMKSARRREISD